jgi:hypothetical protein
MDNHHTAVKPALEKKAWDGTERRGSSRIKLGGTVKLQMEDASFPIWAELADISLGGCYLKMAASAAIGSSVILTFNLQQQELTTKGRVVTSNPGVGAGIKFELEAAEMVALWRTLRKLGSKSMTDPTRRNE